MVISGSFLYLIIYIMFLLVNILLRFFNPMRIFINLNSNLVYVLLIAGLFMMHYLIFTYILTTFYISLKIQKDEKDMEDLITQELIPVYRLYSILFFITCFIVKGSSLVIYN